MPIEYTVESLDQVSEDVRGAYVETDGKFSFDPDRYADLKAAGLKKKTSELLGKVKQKDDELARFGKFKSLTEMLADADESELEEFQLNWQKRGEKSKGKSEGDDPAKLELKEKIHQREVKKLTDTLTATQTEFEKVKSELKDFKLWTPLRDVFIKAGGDPQDWEVARLELSAKQQFGFDDDGKVVVLEDGQPSSVSPDKFFREVYSEHRPKFYKANMAGGSGAPNNTAGGIGRGSITLSREQAKDPATYRNAKERAAKNGVELVINE